MLEREDDQRIHEEEFAENNPLTPVGIYNLCLIQLSFIVCVLSEVIKLGFPQVIVKVGLGQA